MTFKLIDNKKHGLLGDTLTDLLEPDSNVSIITSYFTVYALNELLPVLRKVKTIRILLPQNPFNPNIKFEPSRYTDYLGDRSEIQLKSKLDLHGISQQAAKLIESKVKIRASRMNNLIGTKLILIESFQRTTVITLSSNNLNSSGLGYTPSETHVMNTLTDDPDTTAQLLEYFNDHWNNSSMIDDIKPKILTLLKTGYKDYSPEYLYYFTLYNLFREYLGDLDEERIVKSRTGFKNTMIWNKLYNFQQDGVLGSIDKIEKFGGCIIADSVGLGKTFEALAIIKYYELRNDRVLVICPKKLRENWTVYTLNDKRNIMLEDRFNYDVLNHTDLSRDQGYSGEINLETINWGNYDLLVIDESHNFRNNNPRRGIETRYQKLMNRIIKAGVKTKVLMLSATPVNNRMNDLKNQVAFITEGDDTAFDDYGILSIHELMKRAQTQFNQWLRESISKKNVSYLVETLDARYFKLLDLITIARSRKHIQKYYDIKDVGEFPVRLKPINIKSDIDLENKFPPLRDINREIRRLNLSAYSPLKYVRVDKQREYSERYDLTLKSGSIFKQLDREQSLIHLMRVNMLKRMESSINSFAITIEKLLKQINNFIEKIQNRSEYYDENLNIDEVDIEDPELEDFLIGNKIRVLLQDMDLIRWKQDLLEDRNRLNKMLESAREISVEKDAKLSDLKQIISQKIRNPINESNKKIVIFTAFADTARYLYENIASWIKQELNIYSAIVTGTGQNKTNLKGIKSEFNIILTNFSPRSKERSKLYPNLKKDIDLLFATDCISEGQNLQDCDFLINYDIHWNPVRIIQRFGRIDRIGSVNKVIQLLNFWPNMELEEYINLEKRVSGRMVLLDISATGEENIIDSRKEMNDLEYRKKQLEQLQNTVIDLEEMEGGISITDLTYNDFKMDLMEFLKENTETLERTPTGIHSIAEQDEDDTVTGIIFCLRQLNSKGDNKFNALDPYYLVYVGSNGEVQYGITQNKKVLDNLQKLCSGISEPYIELIEEFNQETAKGKDMSKFTDLLEAAVQDIVGVSEEKGVASLFTSGGTTTFHEQIKSLSDFELISYLVIK
ncbi:MAG: helicase [Candidatus Cloacimonas sp. SDB]|nr:MAG: helicase [Candidatus Cloacimonas sp. SDB]